MPYRYAVEKDDYSDLAAGPVLYSLPGQPAFPVRLASEIFQRCQAHLRANGTPGPYVLFDPCCGSAYFLTTLALLHWHSIRAIVASDIDIDTLGLAQRNLALLTLPGLEQRAAQLARLIAEFGRPSHHEALASVERLQALVAAHVGAHPIPTRARIANGLDAEQLQRAVGSSYAGQIDMVLTDLPYGQRTAWRSAPTGDQEPQWHLLQALRAVLGPRTIVAITATKAQKVAHAAYTRVEQFQVGKRRTTLLRLT